MKRYSIQFGKILLGLLVMATAILWTGRTACATTIYDGTEGYTSQTPYNDRLNSYVVGSGSTDFDSEFGIYKTYIISHDGVNETRPITLKKGALHVTMYGFQGATGAATIYSDAACTKEAAKINLTSNCTQTASGSYMDAATFQISKTQTYYIRFTNTSGGTGLFQFSSQQYDGSNRKLTSKKLLSYVDVPNGATYFCVEAKKDGYITLKPDFCSNGYKKVAGDISMTLLDVNKKAISTSKKIGNGTEDFADKAVYAVKAGTYWVKVSTDQQRLFTLSCKQTAVKEQGSAKVKTPTVMKKDTWYKGLCTWEDTTSKGDYFSFTLKKAATVTITLKGDVTSGKLTGTVTGNKVNGSYTGLYLKNVGSQSTWKVATKSSQKLPAGTYYIKIAKDTKKSNGYYKLRYSAK